MAGFDEAMERLVNDPRFRGQLSEDPASALSEYDLSSEEAALLGTGLAESVGQSTVEQRTSKAGLAGLLSSALEGGRQSGGGSSFGSPTDPGEEAQEVGHVLGRRHEHTRSETLGPDQDSHVIIQAKDAAEAGDRFDGKYVLGSVTHRYQAADAGQATRGAGFNELRMDDAKGSEEVAGP